MSHLFGFFVFSKSSQHCFFHRTENIFISGAAAQMAGHLLADFVIGVFFAGCKQLRCAHKETGRTETALYGCFVDKRL